MPRKLPSYLAPIVLPFITLALLSCACYHTWSIGYQPTTAYREVGIDVLIFFLSILFFFYLAVLSVIYLIRRQFPRALWTVILAILVFLFNAPLGLTAPLLNRGRAAFITELQLAPPLRQRISPRRRPTIGDSLQSSSTRALPRTSLTSLVTATCFSTTIITPESLCVIYDHEGVFHLYHDLAQHEWFLADGHDRHPSSTSPTTPPNSHPPHRNLNEPLNALCTILRVSVPPWSPICLRGPSFSCSSRFHPSASPRRLQPP